MSTPLGSRARVLRCPIFSTIKPMAANHPWTLLRSGMVRPCNPSIPKTVFNFTHPKKFLDNFPKIFYGLKERRHITYLRQSMLRV
jgi:hypothetical protein